MGGGLFFGGALQFCICSADPVNSVLGCVGVLYFVVYVMLSILCIHHVSRLRERQVYLRATIIDSSSIHVSK